MERIGVRSRTGGEGRRGRRAARHTGIRAGMAPVPAGATTTLHTRLASAILTSLKPHTAVHSPTIPSSLPDNLFICLTGIRRASLHPAVSSYISRGHLSLPEACFLPLSPLDVTAMRNLHLGQADGCHPARRLESKTKLEVVLRPCPSRVGTHTASIKPNESSADVAGSIGRAAKPFSAYMAAGKSRLYTATDLCRPRPHFESSGPFNPASRVASISCTAFSMLFHVSNKTLVIYPPFSPRKLILYCPLSCTERLTKTHAPALSTSIRQV